MIFFGSLIPGTVWLVLGYFVLFSSGKSRGAVQSFGRVLAIWLFILAALFPVMGAYAAFTGFSPTDAFFQSMQTLHGVNGPQ